MGKLVLSEHDLSARWGGCENAAVLAKRRAWTSLYENWKKRDVSGRGAIHWNVHKVSSIVITDC